ncbi:MAG: gluconate 2-dehydrogenase subunit 3 family protein [Bacteroidetes bacterium]|nr:gluconate 2-dehydrogenase subunit 3 family protein [Bacteroidota bacterium]
MNRRDALSRIGILVGGTISASTMSGLLAGCFTPAAEQFTPQILSSTQYQLLGRIAEIIIPETDTPGALAVGVDRFIDNMLANYYATEEAISFQSHLDAFRIANDADNMDTASLESVLTQEDAKAYDGLQPSTQSSVWFFRLLKELIVSGYYTSEIGMNVELRLRPFGKAQMDIDRSEIDRTWAN